VNEGGSRRTIAFGEEAWFAIYLAFAGGKPAVSKSRS